MQVMSGEDPKLEVKKCMEEWLIPEEWLVQEEKLARCVDTMPTSHKRNTQQK